MKRIAFLLAMVVYNFAQAGNGSSPGDPTIAVNPSPVWKNSGHSAEVGAFVSVMDHLPLKIWGSATVHEIVVSVAGDTSFNFVFQRDYDSLRTGGGNYTFLLDEIFQPGHWYQFVFFANTDSGSSYARFYSQSEDFLGISDMVDGFGGLIQKNREFSIPAKTSFKIYSLTGEKIFENTDQEQRTIAVTELPKGIYIAQVQTSRGVQSRKILLE